MIKKSRLLYPIPVVVVLTSALLSLTDLCNAQQYLPDGEIPADLKAFGKTLRPATALPKLETPLSQLYLNRDDPSKLSPDVQRQLRRYLKDSTVQIVVVLQDKSNARAMKKFLEASRGNIIAEFENRIEAEVPVRILKALSERTGVQYIRRPLPTVEVDPVIRPVEPAMALSTGNAVTEGVAATNADAWHARNITGSGVKLAVLDQFKYMDTAQLVGELPAQIDTEGSVGLLSPHGTAVAEIIYDMAPGASLTFATPYSATQMASQIITLAQAGNKIISSSLAIPNDEPGDGTGTVSSAINAAAETYGTLYCQAAGNNAQVHWDGYFSDLNSDNYNDFNGSSANINQLGYISAGSIIALNLRWNDWPSSDQDYDLHLVYWTGSSWQFAASSLNVQDGTQPPTESIFISAPSDAYYGAVIYKYSADGNQVLDLTGRTYPLQFNQKSRSLVDEATADKSFSVAAIDSTTFAIESYSSHGPTHGPGGSLSGGTDKPRIAGFANVDTWSYGAGVFNGTSAATPHVSGAAALLFQAFPFYSSEQVMHFLENAAVDQGISAYDYIYGAGRLDLGDPPYSITVVNNEAAAGTVASSPAGIDCGAGCSANFPPGNKVVLTASAAKGFKASWIDCRSQGGTIFGNNSPVATCTLPNLDGNKTLTATFRRFYWSLFVPAIIQSRQQTDPK